MRMRSRGSAAERGGGGNVHLQEGGGDRRAVTRPGEDVGVLGGGGEGGGGEGEEGVGPPLHRRGIRRCLVPPGVAVQVLTPAHRRRRGP